MYAGGEIQQIDRSEFYSMITENFKTSYSLEKTLAFSLALLFRKHLMFHTYNTSPLLQIEGEGDRTVDALNDGDDYLNKLSPYGSVDLAKFQSRASILAHALGFVNQQKAEFNLLSLLTQLKTFCAPRRCRCTGKDLDVLLEHLNVSVDEIKKHWLENNISCDCSAKVRENDILSAVYLELLTEKIAKEKGCSYQIAQSRAAGVSERELLCGMLRLALEMWTLDYDLMGFSDVGHPAHVAEEVAEYQDQLYRATIVSDGAFVPTTLQVVMDTTTNKPAAFLPRPCSQKAMLVTQELEHPYIQLKSQFLTNERGYSASVANKLLIWGSKPSNMVIPLDFLVLLLNKANECGKFLLNKVHARSPVQVYDIYPFFTAI